jgi:RNA polymerase sigma factor (sigma-70 family)
MRRVFPWYKQFIIHHSSFIIPFSYFCNRQGIPASKGCMMQHNDIQLIGRILDGDTSGYAVLVERYKDLAYTIAFRILGIREDAEEVVQDAFVKAFQYLSSFRQKAKFSTWLYRIIYNTAISKHRQKKPGWQSIEEITVPDNAVEFMAEEEEDRHKMLETAMQQLPEEDRILLTLYYVDESSVDDLHSILGISKANVKIKLFRARKRLQELLAKTMVTVYN